MSISQLFQPNSYNLYCSSILADNLTPNTSNQIISNTIAQITFLKGVEYFILPATIQPSSISSRVRVQLLASIYLDIGGGELLTFYLQRDGIDISSFEFVNGLTTRFPHGELLNFDYMDQPNSISPVTYRYRVVNQSTGTFDYTCYLSRLNRTNIQTVLTEV